MNVLVSACLLGVNCKYSGGNNYDNKIIESMDKCTLIPICPEQLGGLRTPRNPAEIRDGNIYTNDGVDVTQEYLKGAEETLKIAKLYNCKYAILKERSPSCGKGIIYDGTFSHTKTEGDGVTSKLLMKNGIKVFGENEINELIKILYR